MKFYKKQIFIVLILYNLPFFFGCAVQLCPECEKDGIVYGWKGRIFREDWDDYYQCALSYIEGSCFDKAVWALKQALQQKDTDMRKARTFSRHYIDYFPHRELGITLCFLGELELAKYELEKSLESEISDKAFYFLDEVRKAMMEQEDKSFDLPTLKINMADEIWINDNKLTISGSAQSDQFISEIMVKEQTILPSGKHLFIDFSDKKVSFKEEFILEHGLYFFDVIVKNLLNAQTKKRISVHVDRKSPLIYIDEYVPGIHVKGYINEDSKEKVLLKMNNQLVVSLDIENRHFQILLTQLTDQNILCAVDRSGNETLAVLGNNQITMQRKDILYAENHYEVSDAYYKTNNKLEFTGITLLGLSDNQRAFSDHIYIEGYSVTENSISQLWINEKRIIEPNHPTSIQVFFCHPVWLKDGINTIIIRSIDIKQKEIRKIITVHNTLPDAFQLKHRYRLGISPFKRIDTDKYVSKIELYLMKNFQERKRFQILLRKGLEKIGPVSAAPADSILKGKYYLSRYGIEVVVNFIDVHTDEILDIEMDKCFDAYADAITDENIQSIANRLVDKFHIAFQVADGSVSERFIFEPFPKNDNLLNNWPILLYDKYKVKKNPVSNKILGFHTQIVGYGLIVENNDDGTYGLMLRTDISNYNIQELRGIAR